MLQFYLINRFFSFQPIKTLLDDRKKTVQQSPLQDLSVGPPNHSPVSTSSVTYPHRSIYREILFLTLVSLGQDNIDLTAFDREYRRAFDHLPAKYLGMAQKSDHPPTHQVIFCRKMFRELII